MAEVIEEVTKGSKAARTRKRSKWRLRINSEDDEDGNSRVNKNAFEMIAKSIHVGDGAISTRKRY